MLEHSKLRLQIRVSKIYEDIAKISEKVEGNHQEFVKGLKVSELNDKQSLDEDI